MSHSLSTLTHLLLHYKQLVRQRTDDLASLVMMNRLARQFSTTSFHRDTATCQLLGKFGSTPSTFTTRDGQPGVRYLFAVNRGSMDNATTSWFNVVSFDERAIERLTVEDLKGAKALVNGTLDVRRSKDDKTGQYSDQVNIKQISLHIIERSKKTQAAVPSNEDQAGALEDSFSV
ncbi:Putative uncharacterized protein [Taphrina deformans PYCC 5710]|uniref:SsDNA binding protein n=1 Tax=Taphrina deformans (strain PYCC 5710 / ATCC 11124 / CBS 356.35 / IMI 108563 / JCM 9778 / NBRC 8474) TaxID=1097556 RepID=R4XBW6_TAPDE|nr:Putative uncharacterized protein [Taphrina deformans PYCC 5710]|eukprot:CCG81871.1 Putative uncharacterized protein [Taphrina deformans PYCC 5710]